MLHIELRLSGLDVSSVVSVSSVLGRTPISSFSLSLG